MAASQHIAIHLPNGLLVIEVKIDAAEGPDQLSRYDEIAEIKASALGLLNRHTVYLTCRRQPTPPDIKRVTNITWMEISRAIRRALAAQQVQESFAGSILAQFADHCSSLR